MNNNQKRYIEYVSMFAKENKMHIWLGGSFLKGTATKFSDVDISVFCTKDELNKLIYGYGKPVYISYTQKPTGILIIIYEDGVAVDIEMIENIYITDSEFFHMDDIKIQEYSRNEKICTEIALRDDMSYQILRLFHRSLIKFLSGKQDIGVSIANEVASFNNSCSIFRDNYKEGIGNLLKSFNEQYKLPIEYYEILCELVAELDGAI